MDTRACCCLSLKPCTHKLPSQTGPKRSKNIETTGEISTDFRLKRFKPFHPFSIFHFSLQSLNLISTAQCFCRRDGVNFFFRRLCQTLDWLCLNPVVRHHHFNFKNFTILYPLVKVNIEFFRRWLKLTLNSLAAGIKLSLNSLSAG